MAGEQALQINSESVMNESCLKPVRSPTPETSFEVPLTPLWKRIQLTVIRRPYASAPVGLRIGAQGTVYHVPRELLQSPEWIDFADTPSFTSWGEHIELPDVDEETGHILVHYLHTGTYQTLSYRPSFMKDSIVIALRKAFCAYVTAMKYKLPGLQLLAVQEMEFFGKNLRICEIVDAIEHHCPKLPRNADTTWLYKFFSESVKWEMKYMRHTSFHESDFLDRVEDVGVARLLTKCLVEQYTEKVSGLLHQLDSAPAPDTEDCTNGADASYTEDAPSERSFISDGGSTENLSTQESASDASCIVVDHDAEDDAAGEDAIESSYVDGPVNEEAETKVATAVEESTITEKDYGFKPDESKTVLQPPPPPAFASEAEPSPYFARHLAMCNRGVCNYRDYRLVGGWKGEERENSPTNEQSRPVEPEAEEGSSSNSSAPDSGSMECTVHSSEAKREIHTQLAKHLVEEDTWADCGRCGAHWREIALQTLYNGGNEKKCKIMYRVLIE